MRMFSRFAGDVPLRSVFDYAHVVVAVEFAASAVMIGCVCHGDCMGPATSDSGTAVASHFVSALTAVECSFRKPRIDSLSANIPGCAGCEM